MVKGVQFFSGLLLGCLIVGQEAVPRFTTLRSFLMIQDQPAERLPYGWGLTVLPLPWINFGHTGFVYRDLIKPAGNDSFELDVPNAISQMRATNYLLLDFYLLDFWAVVRPRVLGSHQFTIGFGIRGWSRVKYSRDLWELLWFGNYPYAGSSKELLLQPSAVLFGEWRVGYTLIRDRWSVGARVKLTSGLVGVWTSKAKGTLYTSPDFDSIYLMLDYEAYAGGQFVNVNTVDSTVKFLQPGIGGILGNSLLLRNLGLALDLGATYDLNDRITLSLAILDLGWVSFKSKNGGTVRLLATSDDSYKGVNLKELLNLDTTLVQTISQADTITLSPLEDSLKKLVDYSVTFNEDFKVFMPVRIYAAGRYKLNNVTEAWFSAGVSIFQGVYPVVSLGIARGITEWFLSLIHI